jgi:hypothetical protein
VQAPLPAAAPPESSPAPSAPPPGPQLAGCTVFPADSAWNRDVSRDPVDAHSADYLAAMSASSLPLQPDFGQPPYGMPVTVVSASQPRVPMNFRYATQSDPGPYPIPQDVRLQSNDDRHAAVLDRDACKLYETYLTYADGQGGFRADSGAVFDLRSSALRPDGWTSATASGLPMVAGMVRYEETAAGEIRHALAFIPGPTAHAFVHPATHSAGTNNAQFAPPMGLRVRLRADFDVSKFHGASLVVLRAMQRYGMLVIDNSSGMPFWAVSGEQDARWNMADLDQLKSVPARAFEVVQLGEVHAGL